MPVIRSPRSAVIFRGQVTNTDDTQGVRSREVTVDVKHLWKGETPVRTAIDKERPQVVCGSSQRFLIGEEYLFYVAPYPDGTFLLDSCARIVPIHQSLPDLAYLVATGAIPGTPLSATPISLLARTYTTIPISLALIALNLLLTVTIFIAARIALRRLRRSPSLTYLSF